MTRLIHFFAGSLLGIMLTAAASAQDSVYTHSGGGTPVRGNVLQMSKTEVTVNVNGVDRKIPVNDIRKINYSGEPNELRTARQNVLDGRFSDALATINKISPDDIDSKVIQQDVDYYKAYCQAKLAMSGGGDKAAAGRALKAFIDKNGGSYHYYDAIELFGDLAVSAGSYSGAAAYYNQLAQAPWPDFKMRANVLEARALVAQDKYAEALQKYEAVIASNLDTAAAQSQKLMATVGKAVCLAEAGNPEEGIRLIEDVIANNDPQNEPQLFSRAYNALGRCYLKQNKTKDALLAYLHVDILFYSDNEMHAEALYNLSNLWGKVNKADRAVRARGLLKERYPGSVWAKK